VAPVADRASTTYELIEDTTSTRAEPRRFKAEEMAATDDDFFADVVGVVQAIEAFDVMGVARGRGRGGCI
jgi:hypothetical protein